LLSLAAKDGPLGANVLDGFERAYAGDRSDIIWLPEQVEAFLAVGSPEMQLAMALAPHTGKDKVTFENWLGQPMTVRPSH
jgi:hypothetical protein